MTGSSPIRILTDDHPLVRDGSPVSWEFSRI